MSAQGRFERGDAVRVREGPFRGFAGVVSGYDADADRLLVTVPVFGRLTLVPLDRSWAERIR
jgi:transcriptional antiterminator NusG